ASLHRTTEAMDRMAQILAQHPAVRNVSAVAGFDLLSGSVKTSAGTTFVTLKGWDERTDPAHDARSLPATFMAMTAGIRDALTLFFIPPPIAGLSTTGGFDLYVQDRTGGGEDVLSAATAHLVEAAAQRSELAGVRTTFDTNVPQYSVELDRVMAKALGVSI